MSRLKILVFLFAVGIAGSIITAAYWYYTRVLVHNSNVEGQIADMRNKKGNPPDPGIRRFNMAVDMIKEGKIKEGRKALYELIDKFRDSSRVPEAKRIVGEINMDMLFSINTNASGKDYIVQPGDRLLNIAGKNQTTIECILRANSMLTTGLHPGDKLFLFPLSFELVVDLDGKTVTLMRNGSFFKEYDALDIKLPPGMRAPVDMVVNGKSAVSDGKAVSVLDTQFTDASKSIVGSKSGLALRSPIVAKPVDADAQKIVPQPKTTRQVKKGTKPAANDNEDTVIAVPQTGIFLAREDIEELFTLIRSGTKMTVLR